MRSYREQYSGCVCAAVENLSDNIYVTAQTEGQEESQKGGRVEVKSWKEGEMKLKSLQTGQGIMELCCPDVTLL